MLLPTFSLFHSVSNFASRDRATVRDIRVIELHITIS